MQNVIKLLELIIRKLDELLKKVDKGGGSDAEIDIDAITKHFTHGKYEKFEDIPYFDDSQYAIPFSVVADSSNIPFAGDGEFFGQIDWPQDKFESINEFLEHNLNSYIRNDNGVVLLVKEGSYGARSFLLSIVFRKHPAEDFILETPMIELNFHENEAVIPGYGGGIY